MSAQDSHGINRIRRGFFRRLVAETISTVEEARGVPQLRLDQIGAQPDDVIGAMVPEWNLSGEIRLHDTRLVRVGRDGTPGATLLELGPLQLRLLALFDGRHDVDAIATAWAEANGLPIDEAFAQVKRLFLPLAELAVLVPAASIEP
jgi:hypothetical protein